MANEHPAPVASPRPLVRALTLLALAIATVAAFASLRHADWILFDDTAYVTRNPDISGGLTLRGLEWVLRHPHGGNFHPLTSVSHMLDSEIFGLSPRGPHLVNLGLHVVNALLVCLVLARYTGAWWPSACVAGFFALHPLRVESVAWVSERKDVLSTLFFLLTLLLHHRYVQVPSLGRFAGVMVAFALGLAAKPMLVTLPALLLLLDVWPLGRARWPLLGRGQLVFWREKWPLFVLALASIVVTFWFQHTAGAVMKMETFSLGQRALNALASYARYLGSIGFPHDLAIYYPLVDGWPIELASLGAALLLGVTFLAWRARRRVPAALVGWLWFVGTLVPVIGLVQVGAQSHADRYTYIPSIGLSVAVVWIVAELTARSRAARAAASAIAITLLGACGFATARQTEYWRDTRTLFTRALEVTPRNAIALQNLGNAVLLDGEVDTAIAHLEEALRIIPDFPDAENNLGTALGRKGRHAEAIEHFRKALRTENTAEVHQNLGWALEHAGRGDEAILAYETAIRLDPDFAAPRDKLGAALCARGRYDEALVHLNRALELDPHNVETWRSLAIARTLQGNIEAGIEGYRALLQRAPNDLDALNNIAWIRATHVDAAHRDGAEAVRLAERARDLPHDPNHVLFSTLAAAYAEVGRFDEAVRAAERAVELARAADDADAASRFTAQLERYRRGEPLRL